MQRCELAEECSVCNVPFCPYSNIVAPNEAYEIEEWDEWEDMEEEGW